MGVAHNCVTDLLRNNNRPDVSLQTSVLFESEAISSQTLANVINGYKCMANQAELCQYSYER